MSELRKQLVIASNKSCASVHYDFVVHSFLQRRFQELYDLGTNLCRLVAAAEVSRAQAFTPGILVVQHLSHGFLNSLRGLLHAQGVSQEHRRAEDCADGVRDALAGDVWRRAVDRLIETGRGLEVWRAVFRAGGRTRERR